MIPHRKGVLTSYRCETFYQKPPAKPVVIHKSRGMTFNFIKVRVEYCRYGSVEVARKLRVTHKNRRWETDMKKFYIETVG